MITSRTLHVGSQELRVSQSDLRIDVIDLVRETERRLTTAGMFTAQPAAFTTSQEAFANQLLQMSGQVTIGVVAAQPIPRAGPALLEFVILN